MIKLLNQLPRWLTWGLALPLLTLNAWVILQILHYFHSLIAILITANLLAFILQYPVHWLQRQGLSRSRAVLLMLLCTLTILIILGVTLLPIVIDQLEQLVKKLPNWIQSGSGQLQMLQTWAQSRNLPVDLSNIVVQMEARLSTQLQTGGERLLTASLGLAGRFFDLVLTMVLTFYLLLHGKQVWDGIFRWLPSQFRLSARQSLRQVFHNYFVGQVALALLMGSSITVAFLLLRVPFGLLFGLMIGLMALVPFGGILMICLVSFLMALQSIGLGLKVLIVAVLIEQVIENGVAPHLIGSFTGLNPVWILVSLLIGGKIGGFLGILVAVPLASFIKVMVDQFTRPMDVADSEVPNAEIS